MSNKYSEIRIYEPIRSLVISIDKELIRDLFCCQSVRVRIHHQ